MPNYRRPQIPGCTVFLTAVTKDRLPILTIPINVAKLRIAVQQCMAARPFQFDAAVILPDHLHFLWTLPANDMDFSTRLGVIKKAFTQALGGRAVNPPMNASSMRRREAGVWQKRFWDHVIQDEDDYQKHVEYIHYNAVRHGYCRCPKDWQYSSFARWVAAGLYSLNWGCDCEEGSFQAVPDLDISGWDGE